ncbi:hypothetical protein [Bradyrhizobium sp. 5.13L]
MIIFLRNVERKSPRAERKWKIIRAQLEQRRKALIEQRDALAALGATNPFALAATDVFVEKAQDHLTERGWVYYRLGIVCASFAFIIIALAFYYVSNHSLHETIADLNTGVAASPLEPDRYRWNVAVLLLRTATLGGFAAAAIYFFASLCRAFLHEATLLFARRHSIRLGRLYIYAKYGAAATSAGVSFASATVASDGKPASDMSELVDSSGRPTGINIDDLEKAFGWNIDVHTAFKDIKAERMSTTIFAKAMETLADVVKNLSEAAKEKRNK